MAISPSKTQFTIATIIVPVRSISTNYLSGYKDSTKPYVSAKKGRSGFYVKLHHFFSRQKSLKTSKHRDEFACVIIKYYMKIEGQMHEKAITVLYRHTFLKIFKKQGVSLPSF